MKVRLHKRAIDEAVYEGPGGCYLWNTEMAGFGVRIYPTGRKSFAVSYWTKGRRRFYTLGPFGKLTLHQAKSEALVVFLRDRRGEDPAKRCLRARFWLQRADRSVGIGQLAPPETIPHRQSGGRPSFVSDRLCLLRIEVLVSISVLFFLGLMTVALVLWRSGFLSRWQERQKAKSEEDEAIVRSRQREDRRRENRRRSEEEEKRSRILMRSIPSAESKRTRLGNIEIHTLEVAGDGGQPPVVLIHSFAGRKEEWGPTIERLASVGFRVVAPDLPGCGGSPVAEDGDHDIPAQTRRIRALADKKGLLPCHLVGAGIGGTIAMLWAARNPESIVSLGLIEPFGFRVPWETPLDQILASGRNPLLPREDVDVPARRELLYSGQPSLDSESESLHMEDLMRNHAHHVGIWERSRSEDRAGLLDVLAPEILVPVFYLQGGESHVVHPKTAQLVESLFGDRAEVHVLPDCGHLPAVERPQMTVSLLLPFWQQVASQAS